MSPSCTVGTAGQAWPARHAGWLAVMRRRLAWSTPWHAGTPRLSWLRCGELQGCRGCAAAQLRPRAAAEALGPLQGGGGCVAPADAAPGAPQDGNTAAQLRRRGGRSPPPPPPSRLLPTPPSPTAPSSPQVYSAPSPRAGGGGRKAAQTLAATGELAGAGSGRARAAGGRGPAALTHTSG